MRRVAWLLGCVAVAVLLGLGAGAPHDRAARGRLVAATPTADGGARAAAAAERRRRRERHTLVFKHRRFEPRPGIHAAAILAQPTLPRAKQRHFLIQFQALPDAARRHALARSGVRLSDYVSGNTYVAATGAAGLKRRLRRLPGVRAAFPLAPADKLEPNLTAAGVPAYARRGDDLILGVTFHSDVPTRIAERVVERSGGRVLNSAAVINLVTAAMPLAVAEHLSALDVVEHVDVADAALRPKLDQVRAAMKVTSVVVRTSGLTGAGVTGLVYDGGPVASHIDLPAGTKVIEKDAGVPDDHATHVAGIFAGSGQNSLVKGATVANQWQGVAPQASIISYEGSRDWYFDAGSAESDFKRAMGPVGDRIDLATMSLGDTITASRDCHQLGDYTNPSRLQDEIVRGKLDGRALPWFTAAGNEREQVYPNPSMAQICQNYNTVLSPATSKNAIAVGATNSDGTVTPIATATPIPMMTNFSSWGPTDDGRVKPDVTAPGCRDGSPGGVVSTVFNDDYDVKCGTSMATPAVAGLGALLIEHWRKEKGRNPQPHTLKAILVHTADEPPSTQAFQLGNVNPLHPPNPLPAVRPPAIAPALGRPGPDYVYGWGMVDAERAVQLVVDNHESPLIHVDSVDRGQTRTYRFWSPGSDSPTVTLAWDDPASTLLAGDNLINDLDVKLIAPDAGGDACAGSGCQEVFPWVLDPSPALVADRTREQHPAPAVRGINVRDNVEQISDGVLRKGVWTVVVTAARVPKGPQEYTLILPPANRLSVADTAVREGDFGTRRLSFRVALDPPPTGSDVSVDYQISAATATEGSDYQPTPAGTLTFSAKAHDREKFVTVDVDGDLAEEPDERFALKLSNPRNAWIEKDVGWGVITDDDTPPPLDVVAKTGKDFIAFEAPSINRQGKVAFIGRTEAPGLWVGDETPDSLVDITRSTNPAEIFGGGVQINDDGLILAQHKSGTRYTVRLYDSAFPATDDGPARFSVLSSQDETVGTQFDALVGSVSLGNTDSRHMVYGGVKLGDYLLAAPGAPDKRDYERAAGKDIAPLPMVSDDGHIVARLGDRHSIASLELLSDTLAPSATIASGWKELGRAPGISDDGRVVAFFGEVTDPEAARLKLKPGPGIFAAVRVGAGIRIIRIAGSSTSGYFDPGETGDTNNNLVVDAGETERGPFTGFFSGTRVAVNRPTSERPSALIAFLAAASPGGAKSLVTVRLHFESKPGVPLDIDAPAGFSVGDPVTIAATGEDVPGLGDKNPINDLEIYDPLNDRMDGDVAFLAHFVNGSEAILKSRSRPRPLLFIPDILGSELTDAKDGAALWPPGPATEMSALRQRLSLPDVPGTRMFAPGLLRAANFKDRDMALGYGPLIDALVQRGGYKPYDITLTPDDLLAGRSPTTAAGCRKAEQAPDKPDLFVFPYDWRQDNEKTAIALADYVACIESFYPGVEIDVLAHGMGGLIARRYIIDHADHHVASLTTLATPFLGAPSYANALLTGDLTPGVTGDDIRELVESLTAVHQLAPSQDYERLGGAPVIREDGYDLNGKSPSAESYIHSQLADLIDQRTGGGGKALDRFHGHTLDGKAQDDWTADPTNVVYRHIYTVRRAADTISQTVARNETKCQANNVCSTSPRLQVERTLGDGVVGVPSLARMGPRGDLNRGGATIVGLSSAQLNDDFFEHYGMTSNPRVLDQVLQALDKENPGKSRKLAAAAPENAGGDPLLHLIVDGADAVSVRAAGGADGLGGATLAAHARDFVMPADGIYAAEFKTLGEPLLVVSEIAGEFVTKFQDVNLPAGTAVRANSGAHGFSELDADTDGDGSFETKIAPSVDVTGEAAADQDPPTVRLRLEGTVARLEAADTDSGVSEVRWSTDGEHFAGYVAGASLDVDPRDTPFVWAWAADHAGNRGAPVRLRLRASNAEPVAQDAALSVAEDGSVPVNLAGTDDDGDTLAYEVTEPPAHGELTGRAPALTYVPAPGFSGEDRLRFRVDDGVSASAIAEVKLTVHAVNDAPEARPATLSMLEDGAPLAVALAASDEESSELTYTIVDPPDHGQLSGPGAARSYVPARDFHGEDSFAYTVTDRGDPDGCSGPDCSPARTSDPARVTIDVAAVDDPPRVSDREVATDEEMAVPVALEAVEPDGEDVTFQIEQAPAHGTLSGTAPALVYTPARDFNGADVIRYRAADAVSESGAGEIRVRVRAVNDPPQARDGSIAAVEGGPGVPVDFAPLIFDRETADADLAVEIVRAPARGTLRDGVYTPGGGPDSFTYRVRDRGDPDGCPAGCDAPLVSEARTISVVVAEANDAPVAADDAVGVDEDGSMEFDVIANDVPGPLDEAGQTLSVNAVGAPPHGEAEIVAAGPRRGWVRYSPAADYFGEDAIPYTVCDDGRTAGQPAPRCADAVLRVTVRPVNDPPRAVADTVTTAEDTAVTFDPAANDDAGDPGDAVRVNAAAGAEVLADGRVRYRPAEDFNGVDVLPYTVCDLAGACAAGVATITMSPANDPPVAVSDRVVTDAGAALTVDVLANDRPGPDDEASQRLTLTAVGAPGHGRAELVENAVRYVPEAGFAGPDGFAYTVCDELGLCAAGRASVDVASRNGAPVVALSVDGALVEGGAPVRLRADALDPDGDALTYAWSAAGGRLVADGASAGLAADDGPADIPVTVIVTDPAGLAATGEAVVHVAGAPPSASAGPDLSAPWGVPVTLAARDVGDAGPADVAAGVQTAWTFGDVPWPADGAAVTHAYAEPGRYVARVNVTDKDGQSAEDAAEVTILRRTSAIALDQAPAFAYLPGTLSARLSDTTGAGGARLAGHVITFVLDRTPLSATTDARGVATVTLVQPPPIGAPSLQLRFDGDRLYEGASVAPAITVSSSRGRVTARRVRLLSGAHVTIDVRNAAGQVKGSLAIDRGQLRLRSRTVKALGLDAGATTAWLGGTLTDKRRFLVEVEKRMVRLWINGRPFTGLGRAGAGSVTIRR